ncbi:Crp/Fnr family transcriptional regulator [Deminuibacter soli]|uniref:Crp/Fnr family transcriptional regulator n=1 Tax=Deminuibacter soli TaxID=2291815 RepID=A0A3E1NEL1_9BACT|nr:Crp/Fnr family transcriptional regulator [Deminuibacter soli]RFM26420.1 Crp/Fnr family transcriptional regulator [Deminuibacter soli]
MIVTLTKRFPHLAPLLEKYAAQQQRLEYPAKTILLHEGKVAQHYYFVEQGCLRVWFNNNGKDTTVQFFFENEGVASIESFRKNIPSIFTIETVEPTTVQVLPKKVFNELINNPEGHPYFLQALIDFSFERQQHYMNEFLSRIRDTPEQRYSNLLNDRPHIVQRVAQHYIASYLGITSVHLSRIKNKLAQKKKSGRI